MYDNLFSAQRERVQAVAEMRGLLGRVVRPRRQAAAEGELAVRQVPSVTGTCQAGPEVGIRGGHGR